MSDDTSAATAECGFCEDGRSLDPKFRGQSCPYCLDETCPDCGYWLGGQVHRQECENGRDSEAAGA